MELSILFLINSAQGIMEVDEQLEFFMSNTLDEAMLLIPTYNEEERLKFVLIDCKQYFKNILCVNDGSNDMSYLTAKTFGASIIINHCINCGQGTALMTGFKYFIEKTKFKYLITFDSDGQHLVQDAISMLNLAQDKGLDVVFGSRLMKKDYANNIPLKRKVLINLARIFERLFYGVKLSDAHNGLRVLNRRACKELLPLQSSSMAHATEITVRILQANLNYEEYPCKILYNKNNKKSQSSLNSLNILSDLIQKK